MRGGSALVLLGILVLLHSFAVVNDKFSDFVGFIIFVGFISFIGVGCVAFS